MMGKKSSVVVHTPRNVDLPPHVVMIRGSEDEALYMSSENGEQKPTVSYPRKRCLCLCAWLLGLILLCIGVFIIIHYLLVDTSETLTNKDTSSMSNDEKFSKLFKNFDISNVCNDSLESSLTLSQKFSLSDYVVVGNIVLHQQDMKRSVNHANYGDIHPAIQYMVEVDSMPASLLKGSVSQIFQYNDETKQILLDIDYDNECQSPLAIAASSRQPHILFFVSNSKFQLNEQTKNTKAITLLFHPRPSSEKLVQIIRRLDEDDSIKRDENKVQSSVNRFAYDLPRETSSEISSSLPDVSAVKLNGIPSGKQYTSSCKDLSFFTD